MKSAALRRAAPLALALLHAAACAPRPEDRPPPPADAAAAPSDGGVEGSFEGPFPTLPYPAGPYGGAIGDVLPDLTVRGYALTRNERDSRKLPFRDIALSEVRSDPRCKCVVMLFNAAGERCGYCAYASRNLATIVANDTSFCAVEAISFTYDTLVFGQPLQPATRADLDLQTQAGRQPFPVGLLMPDAIAQLGGEAIPAIPDFYFVRPSDMKVIGFQAGFGTALAREVRTRCGAAQTVETVATLSRPRRMVVEKTHAYVADADLGIVKVPNAGGPPVVLAKPAGAVEAIVVDGAHVFWATRGEGGPAEIGHVASDGSNASVLTTAAAGFRSIAVDSDKVYFARDDGVVGRLSRSGGPPETLATESSATSIEVDDLEAFWTDDVEGSVYAMEKGGGAKRTAVKSSSFELDMKGRDILLGKDLLYVFAVAANQNAQVYSVPKRGFGFLQHALDANATSLAFDVGTEDLVAGSVHPLTGAAVVGISTLEDRATRGTAFNVLTPGLRDVVAVGGDGAYLYWATSPSDASGKGLLKRLRR